MPSKFEKSIEVSQSPALVADMQSRVAVVCTHPWGPLGGNMHNNVVLAAVLYFQRHGISTLRFDFCGSQIGRGYRQVEQVKEAADYLLNETNASYILLVGYSYGSLIASSASSDIPACIGCIAIAPPWSVKHWLLCFHSNYHMEKSRRRTNLPKLFVIGDHDNFTKDKLFQITTNSFTNATGGVLKGADHFFVRREKDLMSIIGQWLITTYPQAEGNLGKFGQSEFQLQDVIPPNGSSEDQGYCGIFQPV